MRKLIFSFIAIDIIVFAVLAANGGLNGAPFDLEAIEFKTQLNNGTAHLIDVRTPEEFEDIRIEGAQNIDFNAPDFEAQIAQINKSEPVYLYCRSGLRAARAQRKMKKMGFEEVYNLKGGLIGWHMDGQETINRPGFNFNALLGHEGC